MTIPFFRVNAFSKQIMKGNPAAICILDKTMPEEEMQKIATEMNVSETAFLQPLEEGFSLRWFTPTVEVGLCGHATLASAYVLYEQGFVDAAKETHFFSKAGLLKARREEDWIVLDFPALGYGEEICSDEILEVLGITDGKIFHEDWNWIVEVGDPAIIRSLQPNFDLLKKVCLGGISVTSYSDMESIDFISRVFAPSEGIDEDPVTGSAHCCLGPYWTEKLNKNRLTAYQASARGGVIKIHVLGERVALYGQAVLVIKGEICI